MKYEALKDSFSVSRTPAYCVQGRVYEFGSDPGKHFRCLDQPKKSEKDSLIEQAESMGLDIDKRSGVEKIKAAIEEAQMNGDE